MDNEPDLENLRREVYARRIDLDLTHQEVSDLGGPSTTTMSKIEGGRGPNPRRDVVRKLEAVLRWDKGSVRRILEGGAPIESRPPGTGTRRLAALVAASGFSEDEIAERVGVSKSTVARWRTHGLSELPKAEVMRKIAEVIGRSERDVLYAAGVDAEFVIETVIDVDDDPQAPTG